MRYAIILFILVAISAFAHNESNRKKMYFSIDKIYLEQSNIYAEKNNNHYVLLNINKDNNGYFSYVSGIMWICDCGNIYPLEKEYCERCGVYCPFSK